MEKINIFDNIKYSEKEEIIDELFCHKKLRVERILSSGQTSEEWYDQEEEEFVFLEKGEAEILYEDGKRVSLKAGDMILIPAHKKHKVSYTSSECVWLCVFSR